MIKKLFAIGLIIFLGACAETQLAAYTVKKLPIPGSAPKSQGTFKVGNPYKIMGNWYYPQERYEFTEKGIASWYGPNFHGRKTANGEIFSMHELTAAHPTLQMPSLVRVTNLENGRSLILRVNDRGPYKRGRILDVSKRGAELLGFKNQGTAKIRLEVLTEESRTIAEAAKTGMQTSGVEVAMNQNGKLPEHFLAYREKGKNAPTILPEYAKTKDLRTVAGLTGEPMATGYQNASIATAKPYEYSKDISVDEVGALKEVALSKPIPSGHDVDGRFLPNEDVQTIPVTTSSIYVQAGSFSNAQNAKSLSFQLADVGRSVVQPVEINGQNFYRVRLGPIKDVQAADNILNSVIDRGYKSAMIVVD